LEEGALVEFYGLHLGIHPHQQQLLTKRQLCQTRHIQYRTPTIPNTRKLLRYQKLRLLLRLRRLRRIRHREGDGRFFLYDLELEVAMLRRVPEDLGWCVFLFAEAVLGEEVAEEHGHGAEHF